MSLRRWIATLALAVNLFFACVCLRVSSVEAASTPAAGATAASATAASAMSKGAKADAKDAPPPKHTVRAYVATAIFLGSAVGLGIFFAIRTRNFLERHPMQRDRR